ncbi:C-C motif chemokine 5 isoform X2 [Papio anubis]|uniref:C-C motif chemokine 5 isoform X2 n=1 Tax=Papio anubis TaxID=9555 RepID=UPI0012AD8401|nr:C-C motif chemokine 5 isoform X2 [Papio anubis]
MCNFTYDTGQCFVAILETPLRGYPLTGPIKSQPELQRIPAEDPVTARGPPTASPTGTMKVSVAALAVILIATALCAPASASPPLSPERIAKCVPTQRRNGFGSTSTLWR